MKKEKIIRNIEKNTLQGFNASIFVFSFREIFTILYYAYLFKIIIDFHCLTMKDRRQLYKGYLMKD